MSLPPIAKDGDAETKMTVPRHSIAFFAHPKADTILKCLPACCSQDNPAKYPPISHEDYIAEVAARVFPGEAKS